MSENAKIAKRKLCVLDATVIPKVKKNGQHVKGFLDQLLNVSRGPETPGSFQVTIVHGGSSYEGLAINESADFDIIVILGKPFLAENFEVERDPSGFFTLQWKPNVQRKMFSDCDGYVDAAKLRGDLFPQLKEWVDQIGIPNAQIKCKDGVAALVAQIELADGNIISIDLVPQIAFHSWDHCPDLKPMEEMPEKLRSHIETLNKNASPGMCFTIAVPPFVKPENADQLFNISFSLLEKNFLTSHPFLRDMIRLVKVVAETNNWKGNFGFQSYFAIRVAIKHYNELIEKPDVWEGYVAILKHLSRELCTGTLDGYFIKNQVTCKWKPERISNFQKEIKRILALEAKDVFY